MTKETCLLTTKDFAILEMMRDCGFGRDDPIASILERKIEGAIVMFGRDIPANVATLGSRVTFSINSGGTDTRVISPERMTLPIGMFLPITRPRGLALLGLCAGSAFIVPCDASEEERVVLEEVLYQPEDSRRNQELEQRVNATRLKKPALRVIRGSLHDQTRQPPISPDGFDDPGPSAA